MARPGDVERFDIAAGAIHVHPANAGDAELHVRQSVRREAPNVALLDRLAESARRLGYAAHVGPERSVQGGAGAPVPSMA